MKSIIRVLCALALVTSLAACGDREEAEVTPQVEEEEGLTEEQDMQQYIDSAVAGGAILMDTTPYPR